MAISEYHYQGLGSLIGMLRGDNRDDIARRSCFFYFVYGNGVNVVMGLIGSWMRAIGIPK